MAKILAVDDEEDILFLIKKILEGVGNEVRCATSGWDALLLLDEYDPDLILLDVMMPELSGWETLHLIREKEGFDNTPVAMLTARSLTPEVLEEEAIHELVDYIEKPFSRESLIKRVNMTIIEDLEEIELKKESLFKGFRSTLTAKDYEATRRLEGLHRRIIQTLSENMNDLDEGQKERLGEAIKSQEEAIKVFKEKREALEKGKEAVRLFEEIRASGL